jgi:hypothetical protein
VSPLVLALAGLLGSDALSPVTVHGLSMRAPLDWERSSPDPSSTEFAAPDDAARLAISAYPLDAITTPSLCLRKLLEAVGPGGFTALSLGGQPAAKRVTQDFVGQGEAARVDANRVTTTTILGCSGRLKWVLTWSARTAQAAHFGPMLRRIIDSVAYAEAAPR